MMHGQPLVIEFDVERYGPLLTMRLDDDDDEWCGVVADGLATDYVYCSALSINCQNRKKNHFC